MKKMSERVSVIGTPQESFAISRKITALFHSLAASPGRLLASSGIPASSYRFRTTGVFSLQWILPFPASFAIPARRPEGNPNP